MSFLRQWSKQEKENEQENGKADETVSFPSRYTSKDYAKDPEGTNFIWRANAFCFVFIRPIPCTVFARASH